MYTTTQGIMFEIIKTKSEIIYRDEFGETLTWENTQFNDKLVARMVNSICKKELAA